MTSSKEFPRQTVFMDPQRLTRILPYKEPYRSVVCLNSSKSWYIKSTTAQLSLVGSQNSEYSDQKGGPEHGFRLE